MDERPPPEIEDLYDEDVLARIDGRTVAGPHGSREDGREGGDGTFDGDEVPVGPRPGARRFGRAGAAAAAALLGLAEVLEPERARQHVIEYVPDRLDESGQLVTYHHVPGDPRASRVVIRPWLLGRHLRRHRA